MDGLRTCYAHDSAAAGLAVCPTFGTGGKPQSAEFEQKTEMTHDRIYHQYLQSISSDLSMSSW